jgi:hypothetical protein
LLATIQSNNLQPTNKHVPDMKRITFLAVVLLFAAFTTNAQFRKIPAEVTDSFKAKFANASHVTWRDKVTSFQAEFTQGQDNIKANFSSKGEWLRTEKKYDYNKISSEIKDGFSKSKYANWSVKEVVEVDDATEGKKLRITVRKGDMAKRYLYFSASGQLLSDSMTL